MRQGQRVQQGQVRALAELRAGGVGGSPITTVLWVWYLGMTTSW